ncbi:MAG TPA: thiamine diphosphokinase [Caldilineales bacterium]|nr:thiamine diphosphokinase [Caldilineales bacterium]
MSRSTLTDTLSSPMRIILFANGELPYPDHARALIRPEDVILCADGGARHAMDLGLTPDRVVGDLDSLDSTDLLHLSRDGADLDSYPQDKDDTDLELALRAARKLAPEEVILLGALGGRLDQTLANIFLLAHPDYADLRVILVNGPERAWVVRDELVVRGRPGDILSVIPLTPDVTGLTYHHGLRWTLTDAILPFGSSRGVSNELVAEEARLSLKTGVILVIHRTSR